MAGKEYTGKDKVVKKMTRDGLTEENLRDGLRTNISPKKQEISKKNKKYQDSVTKDPLHEPSTRAAPLHEEGDPDMAEEVSVEKISHAGAKAAGLKSKQLRQYQKKATREKLRDSAEIPEEDLSQYKDTVKKKQAQSRVTKEQKKASKLSFDDEGTQMVKNAGMGIGKKTMTGATMAASGYAHKKLYEAEDDNASVEAAHASEIAMEQATKSLRETQARNNRTSGRMVKSKGTEKTSGKLKFSMETEDAGTGVIKDALKKEQEKKATLKHFWQKKRVKEAYAAAKGGSEAKAAAGAVKSTETITAKGIRVAKEIFKRNRALFAGFGIFALLFMVVAVSVSSCAASIQGGGSLVGMTTYASTDDDIHATENAYQALEDALNAQINNMESTHPGYDSYQYQVDEITHNPYHLISYFTAKYGGFTYAQVVNEIQAIFDAQYTLETEGKTETVTETKTVRVGESLGNVVTSGYCNCSICCGQWAGGATASGAMPQGNHTIAVDASNPVVPMGTKVVMNGVEYTVEDTGNFARYGVAFDVYYDSHAAASAHGHKTWEAYIADDNGSQTVEVTNTSNQKIFYVSLINQGFDAYANANLNEEQKTIYDGLNITLGNRDYLFDQNSYANAGNGGYGYQIPSEALSDEKFAKMIHEAEKYLGYPYVWGGASPSTSFDCSGFVSWVINNCGNGWNVGRQTAEGLRGCCAQVSPSQAKPGDLIFFQNTYPTSGASHVGIYVGNGMMIHCGNPIQYASTESAYWQQHFLGFGRLP
ncbi:MAG: NlpC/P60 family protein [Anaerostipes sp.]|nr:NlpC/P60 family protein [Anaerostipes sp.]MDD3746291.1 NlpC/P60 family protein [Anaerostipes sp.]